MDVKVINQLKEERAGLIARMREMTVTAESEGRDLNAEEAQEFDKVEADAGNLEQRAVRLEKLVGFDTLEKRAVPPDDDENGGGNGGDEEEKPPATMQEWRERRAGISAHDTVEYRAAFYHWLSEPDERKLDATEFRVLSKASAGAGLNLVPTDFQRDLIDSLREYGVMRRVASVVTTTSGDALQWPTVSSHGTASWTAENAAFTASDDAFGQATLNAYKNATLIKVSEELLQDSAFDLQAYIREEFGRRIGIIENTAYMVGDGSGKPTGVAVSASAGVVAASATAITADELIDLFHSLLSPYRERASWIFKDSTIKIIRKLKETTGQYLWQPGLVAGQQDTLFGRPVYIDPDMAAATTGLVSVLFGDFSAYKIRDVDGIAFQRLNELYAENGQVGFRAYHRTDGKLLNTAAVKKLTQL